MILLAATTSGNAVGQLAAAAVLGTLATFSLLPKPKGRSVAFGVFAGIAAVVVLVSWVLRQFGDPAKGTVEQVLFWLFAGGAVVFSTVFVTQRNPARGAIAFAFVIVSVCGLFLLLAAPFLMAATIVIYAGAIIVTFLFVLMLSQSSGASDENDRSREPMLGSLAGFAFLGLILFALYLGSPTAAADAGKPTLPLPARPLTADDRAALLTLGEQLREAATAQTKDELHEKTRGLRDAFADRLGFPLATVEDKTFGADRSIPERLAILVDPRSVSIRKQAEELRLAARAAFDAVENLSVKPTAADAELAAVAKELEVLREKTVLLAARGELPARNVASVGYALYTDYLLAVELAGTILLVATIGAVAIANRKGAAA
jgi:NADH-quinone oxidoreductase subunit J